LEEKYSERILWQKSNYQYDALLKSALLYEEITLNFDTITVDDSWYRWIPVNKLKVSDFSFNTIGVDMSKSAGLPNFGTKESQLGYARQYANEVIKTNPVMSNVYCSFLGFRTQQSPPEEPKNRDIHMDSMGAWVLERESDSKVIPLMQEHWKWSDTYPTEPAFSPPQRWYELMVEHSPKVKTWVVMDASDYNKYVYPEEVDYYTNATILDYEFAPLISDLAKYKEVQTPDGYIERNGGTMSGDIRTSPQNSFTNVGENTNAITKRKLDRYVVIILVNGDDIIIGFETGFNKTDINALAEGRIRKFNPDKGFTSSTAAWFSKTYLDPSLGGPTKPIYLVGNSVIFKEKESDPATSGKEYALIAATAQLEYLEHHPSGTEVVKAYRSIDKYDNSILHGDNERAVSAARAYISRHNYQVEAGQIRGDPRQLLEDVNNSWVWQV
jgi:hypothetical protein